MAPWNNKLQLPKPAHAMELRSSTCCYPDPSLVRRVNTWLTRSGYARRMAVASPSGRGFTSAPQSATC